jgi:hypothetical protein
MDIVTAIQTILQFLTVDAMPVRALVQRAVVALAAVKAVMIFVLMTGTAIPVHTVVRGDSANPTGSTNAHSTSS